MIEVYESFNHLNPQYMWEFFVKKDVQYNLRIKELCKLPSVSSQRYGLNSLSFRGSLLWNNIDDEIKLSPSLEKFKKEIRSWNGISYAFIRTCTYDGIYMYEWHVDTVESFQTITNLKINYKFYDVHLSNVLITLTELTRFLIKFVFCHVITFCNTRTGHPPTFCPSQYLLTRNPTYR